MRTRSGKTEQFIIRPPVESVEELKELFKKCGKSSPNALAVEILELGLSMLLDPNSPPSVPDALLAMRARLRGGWDLDKPTVAVSHSSRDEVFQLVREALAELGVKPATAESALQAVQDSGRTDAPKKPKRPAK